MLECTPLLCRARSSTAEQRPFKPWVSNGPVTQWQSICLLSRELRVRIPPGSPKIRYFAVSDTQVKKKPGCFDFKITFYRPQVQLKYSLETKMTTRRCDHCKEVKDITEINWKFKALGVRHDTCRECMKWFVKRYFQGSGREKHLEDVKERKKAARIFAREYVWNYLTTHPCVKCGESDPRVLEFHHRNESEKDHTISHMVGEGLSAERIQREIDKCDV